MKETDPIHFDLDALLLEIVDDQEVDREARRMLSQDDIQRLVEESRRRAGERKPKQP